MYKVFDCIRVTYSVMKHGKFSLILVFTRFTVYCSDLLVF